MNRLLLLLSLLVPAATALATEILVGPVEIVGYGVFNPRYTGSTSNYTSERIAVDGVEGGRFTEFTTTIEAQPERVFGIEYMINSEPRGARFEVTQVIEIPDEGIKTPGGRVYKQMRDRVDVEIGKKVFFGYGFDFPWEMVPGEWAIQIWHRDFKLAEQRFTVVLPEEPVLAEQ